MSQEKKCELDIKAFVRGEYNVEFPMMAKINVNGKETHPVYKYLRRNSPLFKGEKTQYVPWNFTKFLLDRDGKVVNMFSPDIKPGDMEKEIEKLLG
mmetsp:Transcript_25514/g.35779  ORF Transcript_25514/g.35779 Transcript_25514/m.35779 type:complete len:96 (-) Transcript_25514:35-322(-)